MLILGSSSPRRREILSHYNIPFSVATPPYDEKSFVFDGEPHVYVQKLAREKNLSIAGEFEDDDVLLTADTIVVKDGQIFCKPQTLEEAFEMLLDLSGKTHLVHSGICVKCGPQEYCDVETTEVTFCPLTEHQIRKFHSAVDPLDKAGAYAIQGSGGLLIEKIVGNYDNVMGLPMQCVSKLLSKVDIHLWDYVSPSSL